MDHQFAHVWNPFFRFTAYPLRGYGLERHIPDLCIDTEGTNH